MAWIYKQKQSDHWWIGFRVGTKLFRKTTGTEDRAEAEKQLAKLGMIKAAKETGTLTEEFYRLISGRQIPVVTLKRALDDWISDCRDLGDGTLDRYRDVRDALIDHLGADDKKPLLNDVTRQVLADFLREKRKMASVATVRLYRRILTGFFRFAVDNELVTVNPVPSGKSLKLTTGTKEAATVRRAFTVDELKLIYSKAPSDFWRWMILAGFYFGQRLGDLVTMPWGAVDFEHRQLHLRQGKTGRSVHAPMRAELETFLRARIQEAGAVKPTDPIWPEQARKYDEQGSGPFSNEFYDDILLPAGLVAKRTHKKAKSGRGKREVNPISFHCLRHSFVTILKATGGSQAVAKELAGHSSDAVSDLYTHTDAATLAKAINQLPEVTK